MKSHSTLTSHPLLPNSTTTTPPPLFSADSLQPYPYPPRLCYPNRPQPPKALKIIPPPNTRTPSFHHLQMRHTQGSLRSSPTTSRRPNHSPTPSPPPTSQSGSRAPWNSLQSFSIWGIPPNPRPRVHNSIWSGTTHVMG